MPGRHPVDPELSAVLGAALDSMDDMTRLAVAVDECGIGVLPDDLAEIVQYQYEPGALQEYAAQSELG